MFSAPERAIRFVPVPGEPLKCFEEAVRLCWRLSLDERWWTGPIFWSELWERRDRFGGMPTRFFAEAGEFLFIEAFVVFLEDLLGPGQILLLDEYVASAAEYTSRTSGTAHTGNACVR